MAYTITGPLALCIETQGSYTVDPEEQGYWEAPGSAEIIPTSQTTVDVVWESPGTYTLSYFRSDGLLLAQVTINVVEVFEPTIIGVNSPYAGDTHTYYAINTVEGSVLEWGVQNGSIVSGQGTDTVTVNWTAGGGTHTLALQENSSMPCTNPVGLTATYLSSSGYNTQLANVNASRLARDSAFDAYYEVREERAIKQAELNEVLKTDTAGTSPEAVQLMNDLATLNQSYEENSRWLKVREEDVYNKQAKILETGTFDTQVNQLRDDYPVILYPVRLETKFKSNGESYNLLVRFYPDDIHIERHEKALTQSEKDNGDWYWTEVNGATTQEKRGAWNTLALKHGKARAAWIALMTDPALPAAEFPGIKSSSWTKQQEIKTLPDKFVVNVYYSTTAQSGYSKVGEVESNQVKDIVKFGLDPTNDQSIRTQGPENDQVIEMTGETAWAQDFITAVTEGMAVDIRLDNLSTPLNASQAQEGFIKLVVVGVKVTQDETGTKTLIEENLNSHHYTKDGLGILKVNTPTTNTSLVDSAFRQPDLGARGSYAIERENALFTNVSNYASRADGQRLAEAFGVDNSVFEHIENADGTDISSAIEMKRSVSPLLLGRKMKDMWGNLFSLQDVKDTQDFFEENVFGRGVLPSIRVGHQPYGVLPISVASNWVISQADPKYTFLNNMKNQLDSFDNLFQNEVSNVKRVKGDGNLQDFLETLADQATTSKVYSRQALGPVATFNLKSFEDGLESTSNWYSSMKTSATSKMNALGISTSNGVARAMLLNEFESEGSYEGKITTTGRLSKTSSLENLTGESVNYIEFLTSLSLTELRGEPGQASNPGLIMYDVIRNSIIDEFWFAAKTLCDKVGEAAPWQADELGGVPFVEGGEVPSGALSGGQDPYEILDRVVEAVHASLTLGEYLDSGESDGIPERVRIDKMKGSLSSLATLPSAELEEHLLECLDTTSYRLDGWQLGLVNWRLQNLRYNGSTRVYGSHIGAYGYVEDLKPNTGRAMLNSTELSQIEVSGPVEKDQNAKGHIHAPSMNQASAMAVLKSSYDPLKTEGLSNEVGYPNRINLNSSRVRKALNLAQGMGAGQSLNELLGYEFERYLLDSSASVAQYISIFRSEFPVEEGTIDGATDTNGVVDGLNLFKRTRLEAVESYPYSITGLPGAGTEQDEIEKALDGLQEIFDSLQDVVVSEAVYKIIEGNQEAASSILEQLEKGTGLSANFDSIKSNHPANVFTQSVCEVFDHSTSTPTAWSLPTSSISKANSDLNGWMASMLPNADAILCEVTVDGFNLAGDPIDQRVDVSLFNLNLQPIHLIRIWTSDFSFSTSPMSRLIYAHIRKTMNLTFDSELSIDFGLFNSGAAPANSISFEEAHSLITHMRKSISESRYLKPFDFFLAYNIDYANLDDTLGYDLTHAEGLVTQALSDLGSVIGTLQDADDTLTGGDIAAARNMVYTILPDIIGFGQTIQIPLRMAELGAEAVDEWQTQITSWKSSLEELNTTAQAAWATYTSPTAPVDYELKQQKIDAIEELLKMLFGQDFRFAPRFKVYNTTEVGLALTDSGDILPSDNPLGTEEVVSSVSSIREKVSVWNNARLLSESVTGLDRDLYPIQLPYEPQDKWYALPHPEEVEYGKGKRSLILSSNVTPTSIDSSVTMSGLYMDEWLEDLPVGDAQTGLAFHNNQPNTQAPNCILLAVTPESTGSWNFDDLVDAVNEAFKLAKQRSVNPDILKETDFSAILSASPFSFFGSGNPISFSLNN